MAGMGPPPKPAGQRARRNATIAMTPLPAEGRKGRAPRWPLPEDVQLAARLTHTREATMALREDWAMAADPAEARALARRLETAEVKLAGLEAHALAQVELEAQLWTELWHTPQATMWERLRWTREVAHYVRLTIASEFGSLDSAKEARQLADRLGLTPLALLRLRWEIEAPPATGTTAPRGAGRRSGYAGLRVVDGT